MGVCTLTSESVAIFRTIQATLCDKRASTGNKRRVSLADDNPCPVGGWHLVVNSVVQITRKMQSITNCMAKNLISNVICVIAQWV